MADQINSSCNSTGERELEERRYLMRRADDHRQMADRSEETGPKALHLRFEQLYRERANRIGLVL